MAMFTAKSPPATRVNASTGSKIFRLKAETTEFETGAALFWIPVVSAFRRKSPQRIGAAKSSALGGLEDVNSPSSRAATTSLRPVKSHAVPRGDRAGAATSL